MTISPVSNTDALEHFDQILIDVLRAGGSMPSEQTQIKLDVAAADPTGVDDRSRPWPFSRCTTRCEALGSRRQMSSARAHWFLPATRRAVHRDVNVDMFVGSQADWLKTS